MPPQEFPDAIKQLLDAWLGADLEDQSRGPVFIVRIPTINYATRSEEDLWLFSRTMPTLAADTLLGAGTHGGFMTPPNVRIDIMKGNEFLRIAPQTVGDIMLANEHLTDDPKNRTGRFDHYATDYDWLERPVEGWVGPHRRADGTLPTVDVDFFQYFSAAVDQFRPESQRIRIRVKPFGRDVDKLLSADFYGAGKTIVFALSLSDASVFNDGRRFYSEFRFDDLFGVLKPMCLGTVYGIRPTLISHAQEVYQWDAIHEELQGILEVYEGGLGSAEGGPVYTEEPEVYGSGAFKLNATPDKPLTVSAQGAVFRGKNLLIRSEDVDDAAWIKDASITITTGQGDPLGGKTAERIDKTASGNQRARQTIATLEEHVSEWIYSVYLKEGTAAKTALRLSGPATKDLIITWADHSISVTSGAVGTLEEVPDSGGWYRAEIRMEAIESDQVSASLWPAGTVSGDTGDVTAWGHQLERDPGFDAQGQRRTRASFYKRTTSAVLRFIEQPAQLAEEILFRLGFEPTGLDLLSFSRYDRSHEYAAGVYFSQDQALSGRQALAKLLPDASLFPARAGKMTIEQIREPYDPTSSPALVLDDSAFGDYQEERVPPTWRILVGWRPIDQELEGDDFLGAATGENRALHAVKTRWAEWSDPRVPEVFKDAVELRLETTLVDETAAQAIADSLGPVLRHPRRKLQTTLNRRLYQADCYRDVSVGLPRYRFVDDGKILFGDGTVIEFETGDDVEKEQPAAGLPGLVVGYVDNPSSDESRSRATIWI